MADKTMMKHRQVHQPYHQLPLRQIFVVIVALLLISQQQQQQHSFHCFCHAQTISPAPTTAPVGTSPVAPTFTSSVPSAPNGVPPSGLAGPPSDGSTSAPSMFLNSGSPETPPAFLQPFGSVPTTTATTTNKAPSTPTTTMAKGKNVKGSDNKKKHGGTVKAPVTLAPTAVTANSKGKKGEKAGGIMNTLSTGIAAEKKGG